MAIAAGRTMLVKQGATTIATVRVVKIAFGLDPIDVSSADDAGLRKLFTAYSGQRFTISVEGIESDGILATIWVAPATTKYLTNITLTLPTQGSGADVLAGDMLMTAYEATGDYKDAVQFTATLESAGTWAAT